MNHLFNLTGKTAIVTGGSRGIGAMIAQGLVQSGVKTYITSRNPTELNATAASLSEMGECIAIPSNLDSLEGIKHFVSTVADLEPHIDILINNAGATWGAELDEFPEVGWDKVMNLNVKSLFFLTQQLMPALRAAATQEDPARIINIGSINGLTNPGMDNYSYSASKAAVHHLTRHLGAELIRQHIHVNAIAPGFFPSKMTAHLQADEDEFTTISPSGRAGSLEDIAGTVIYLCSRAGAYMNGQTLVLDGGIVANS